MTTPEERATSAALDALILRLRGEHDRTYGQEIAKRATAEQEGQTHGK